MPTMALAELAELNAPWGDVAPVVEPELAWTEEESRGEVGGAADCEEEDAGTYGCIGRG